MQYTSKSNVPDSVLVPYTKNGREHSAFVSVFADLVKVYIPSLKTEKTNTKPHPKRGFISTFSRRSRKNFLEKLAMLRSADNGWFVTLTYRGLFNWKPTDVKHHIANLRRAIAHRWPNAGGFWRMELKERLSGASMGETVPHFHMLLFGIDEDEQTVREFIERIWSQQAVDASEYGQTARTQVRRIKSRRHAMNYASKYAAKYDPADASEKRAVTDADETLEDDEIALSLVIINWGRHWGRFGALDFGVAVIIETTVEIVVEMRRYAAKVLKSRGSNYANRIRRHSEFVGWAVFGLGDLSKDVWGDIYHSTIWRIWEHSTSLVEQKTTH